MFKVVMTLLLLTLGVAVGISLLLMEHRTPLTGDDLNLSASHQPALGPTPFWGRPAPQPDWRRGDAIDRAASAVFESQWLPRLKTCAARPGSGTDGELRGALYGVDYWVSIDPANTPEESPIRGHAHLAAYRQYKPSVRWLAAGSLA